MPLSAFGLSRVEGKRFGPLTVEAECLKSPSAYNISINYFTVEQFECPGDRDAILKFTCPSKSYLQCANFGIQRVVHILVKDACYMQCYQMEMSFVTAHLTDFASKLGSVFSEAGTILRIQISENVHRRGARRFA